MGSGAMIGLNIGNATICMVELRAAGGGRFEVTSLGIVPTPEGTVMGGAIADAEAVGLIVKELMQQCGARTKQCVSSVAGQTSLVVRVIDVPRMSQKELDDMMKFELERHIPFQANEVILDYKPIVRPNDDPTSPNMEVLLAAAQDEMINAHIGALEKAGLNPLAIDIEPLAAARVLVDLMGGPDETVAMLNIGAGSSEISVVRDGMLAFTRAVPLGGESITQAIQEMFQVTRPEAERIKKEVADAMPPAMPAAPAGGFATPTYDQTAYEQPVVYDSAPAAAPAPLQFEELSFDPQPAAAAPAEPHAAGGSVFSFDLDTELGGDQPGTFDLSVDPPAASAATSATPTSAPAAANPFTFDLDDAFGGVTLDPEPAPSAHSFDLSTEAPATPAPAAPASPFDIEESPLGGTPTAPVAPSPENFPPLDLDLLGGGGAVDVGAVLPSVEGMALSELAPMERAPVDGLGVAPMDVYNTIVPVLVELVGETRRSLEYFTGKFPDIPINRLVIFGGGARLQNIDVFMQNELGIRSSIANPFTHMKVLAADVSEAYLHELGPTMTIAVGLALRNMLSK